MRLPRYRLATLFVAVLVVAAALRVVLGWTAGATRQQQAVARLCHGIEETSRLTLCYDGDEPGRADLPVERPWRDHLWHGVVAVSLEESPQDQDLQRIADLPSLRDLILNNCHFSREARQRLPSLRNLRYLCLAETEFDDDDVAILKELPRLEVLHLNETGMTEEGLKRLGELTHLRELAIALDWEYFGGRQVNQQRFETMLPKCRVLLFEHSDRRFWEQVSTVWSRPQ